jgi:hypothetical protein
MPRANSSFQFQTTGLVSDRCSLASIIIGGKQQCGFGSRNKPMLACARGACNTWSKENA